MNSKYVPRSLPQSVHSVERIIYGSICANSTVAQKSPWLTSKPGTDRAPMSKAAVDSVNVRYLPGQLGQSIWLVISRKGLVWINGKVIGVWMHLP